MTHEMRHFFCGMPAEKVKTEPGVAGQQLLSNSEAMFMSCVDNKRMRLLHRRIVGEGLELTLSNPIPQSLFFISRL